MARQLADRKRLHVVTNAADLMQVLPPSDQVSYTVLGGTLRLQNMALVGPLAEQAASMLATSIAFVAASAIDLDRGLVTTPTLAEAAVQRVAMRVARTVVLVADSSKFAPASLAVVGPLDAFHVLVTDTGAPERAEACFAAAGTQLVRT